MKQLGLNLYIEFLMVVSIVLASSTAAYQRNLVWRTDFSLWSDAVEKSSYKARPYNNFADACEKRGLIDQAIPLAWKSIILNPNPAEPDNNMGLCYLDKVTYDLSYFFKKDSSTSQ